MKREDGERLAQEYKVPFMETSAKTGLNVELAFLAVARYFMNVPAIPAGILKKGFLSR